MTGPLSVNKYTQCAQFIHSLKVYVLIVDLRLQLANVTLTHMFHFMVIQSVHSLSVSLAHANENLAGSTKVHYFILCDFCTQYE